MSRKQKLDRFIENFPDQFGREFRTLLEKYRRREITKARLKEFVNVKIDIACNTIRPIRKKRQTTETSFRPDSFEGG